MEPLSNLIEHKAYMEACRRRHSVGSPGYVEWSRMIQEGNAKIFSRLPTVDEIIFNVNKDGVSSVHKSRVFTDIEVEILARAGLAVSPERNNYLQIRKVENE